MSRRAFLIRCWQEPNTDSDSRPAWRFVLVETGASQPHCAFASLESLFQGLAARLEQQAVASGAAAAQAPPDSDKRTGSA